MSNENSNLRVGSAGAGLFVGSTEITGGVENLLNEISIAPDFSENEDIISNKIMIANLSNSEGIKIYRGDTVTAIPKQHIEWYNIDLSSQDLYIGNEGNTKVTFLEGVTLLVGDELMTTFQKGEADNGDVILQRAANSVLYKIYAVILIFNAI